MRFRLTPKKRKRLAHLHPGSPGRYVYLYRLTTDPDGLKIQGVVTFRPGLAGFSWNLAPGKKGLRKFSCNDLFSWRHLV